MQISQELLDKVAGELKDAEPRVKLLTARDAIAHLLPVVREKQKDNMSLEEIHDFLERRLPEKSFVSFATFRKYLREVAGEKSSTPAKAVRPKAAKRTDTDKEKSTTRDRPDHGETVQEPDE